MNERKSAPHAPKTRALEALAAGLLTTDGQRRIGRHLEACRVCRAELEAIHGYAAALEDARTQTPDSPDWDTLESQLMERVAAHEPRNATVVSLTAFGKRAVLPALAAAAAVVFFVLRPADPPLASKNANNNESQAATAFAVSDPGREEPPAARALRASATAWAGATATGPDGEALKLHEAQLTQGTLLRTDGDGATLHVKISPATGFVLGQDSEVLLATLNSRTVQLELRAGSLTSQVRGLRQGERYEVVAGTYRIAVRGTLFRVVRRGDEVQVDLREGRVAISKRDNASAAERLVRELRAGQRWSSRNPSPEPLELTEDRRHWQPRSLTEALENWGTLQLPALKGPDRWIVAGVSMPARAALSLRLPLGAHTFEVVDARGRRRSIKARLDSPVANLTMADLRVQLGRRTRQPATGTLSPEEIRPVVARGLPRIRACYERALRQAPEMRARLDLRLRVSTRGRVERVRLKGLGDAPARFEGCVTGEAKGWVFPRPRGGPVELSVPLRLEARKGR